jgi:hypothetical protein
LLANAALAGLATVAAQTVRTIALGVVAQGCVLARPAVRRRSHGDHTRVLRVGVAIVTVDVERAIDRRNRLGARPIRADQQTGLTQTRTLVGAIVHDHLRSKRNSALRQATELDARLCPLIFIR